MGSDHLTRREFLMQSLAAAGFSAPSSAYAGSKESPRRNQRWKDIADRVVGWDDFLNVEVDKTVSIGITFIDVASGNDSFVALGRMRADDPKYSGFAVFTVRDNRMTKQRIPGPKAEKGDLTFREGSFYLTRKDSDSKNLEPLASKDGIAWGKASQLPKEEYLRGKNEYIKIEGITPWIMGNLDEYKKRHNRPDSYNGEAEGDRANVFASTDGKEWKQVLKEANFFKILYANGLYVGLGNEYYSRRVNGGTLMTLYPIIRTATELDGEWTVRLNDQRVDQLHAIEYGNGRFVAAGQRPDFAERDAAVLISSDAMRWRYVRSGIGGTIRILNYAGGRFFATTDYLGIYSSETGEKWDWVIKNEKIVLNPQKRER